MFLVCFEKILPAAVRRGTEGDSGASREGGWCSGLNERSWWPGQGVTLGIKRRGFERC